FNKLSDIETQKELIKAIAAHIQQGKSIAIDKPMFELLRKQYRLDDMPSVLARKGVVMNVLEFSEQAPASQTEDTRQAGAVVWQMNRKGGLPASGMQTPT
ncbi:MAG TPA: hypothetical protein VFV28_07890, partial [Limnobacter sp.]|nr:hypothetical protein [Limnobacter sp.]